MLKLIQKEWNDISSIDDQFSDFMNVFLNCVNAHVPIVKLSRKQAKFYVKFWLTRGTKHSIRTKNRLFKVSCKNSHSGPSYEKHKQYNKVLSEVKSLSKQQYFKENFVCPKVI